MKYLFSVPENLAASFNSLVADSQDCFATSDPRGRKIGSGGGTAWLLAQHYKVGSKPQGFTDYLKTEKKILIHAGGQSRRLPAYAPSGKILCPIPVFRWSTGQPIDQTLLDIQKELYNDLMENTSSNQNTLIASGDILVRCPEVPPIPQADVVCFGIWVDPDLASRHGVFMVDRQTPDVLDCMLQKPSVKQLEQLLAKQLFMMDIGIWILSDKAVMTLMKKCGWSDSKFSSEVLSYDLYSTFGTALGEHPTQPDPDISNLSVAIVNLKDGEFYHYGTSRELISSTEKIQNLVTDPRNIWHKKIRVHPSIFVQNADIHIDWNNQHRNIWIENSTVTKNWQLSQNNIITGVPQNNWNITLSENQCLDIVPIEENLFCIRPYGFDDAFRGSCGDTATQWLGKSLLQWFAERGLKLSQAQIDEKVDIYQAILFPVVGKDKLEILVQWMLGNKMPVQLAEQAKQQYLTTGRISADTINSACAMHRLFAQRKHYCLNNLAQLAKNHEKSVFYQCNLAHTARLYAENTLPLPPPAQNTDYIIQIRDAMFRSQVKELANGSGSGAAEAKQAFEVLSKAITGIAKKSSPKYDIFPDQIVWGRCPLRIDLAGGWSDTPPYSIMNGGSVLNVAIDLNGQQPIQVYIRFIHDNHIQVRSIDTGAAETITTYQELAAYNQVGSVFSIPKAALCLAGFHPDYSTKQFASLEKQLQSLGGGLEISLLAAVPKGSGLGTSSILAATLLGTLSNVCSLNWSLHQIAYHVLVLEQMLTTGGGWQDQYGGIFPGLKLVQSESGSQQNISVRRMPSHLFTDTETAPCWLLYYTGITRVAKSILGEIVKGMFLNDAKHLRTLNKIKEHSHVAAEAFQQADLKAVADIIDRSWKLNNRLDNGTCTPQVQAILNKIEGLTSGYKLAGAGGGGYLLICAKDTDCAAKIIATLESSPPNDRARFVKMTVNERGLEISRS